MPALLLVSVPSELPAACAKARNGGQAGIGTLERTCRPRVFICVGYGIRQLLRSDGKDGALHRHRGNWQALPQLAHSRQAAFDLLAAILYYSICARRVCHRRVCEDGRVSQDQRE